MNYRELSRIGGDPGAVRSTANMVRRLLGERITEWQSNFLLKLENFSGPDRLSTRQCEILIDLRDGSIRRRHIPGYDAVSLVQRLFEERFDLPEDQEDYVVALHRRGTDLAPTDREWKHIFALCRTLPQLEFPDHFVPLHS